MPKHYAIVIKDANVAHSKEIERNVKANLERHGHANLPEREQKRLEKFVDEHVRSYVGPKRQAGDLHTVASEDCPDGLPNCRNCGDPAFADSCRAAGHCDKCGTAHGIAPQSVVDANGYELVEVLEAPLDVRLGETHDWDTKTRKFTKKA